MLSTRARTAPPTFARVSSRSRRALVPSASPRAELDGARDIASPPRVAAVARPSPARGERRRRRRDASPQRASRDVKARGVPVLSSLPLVGWAFSTPVASIIYIFVAIRMYLGYDRTTFGSGVPKIAMCGLWPVLAVLSASFRENLKRSL